jgi:ubiquinone/menaquinone biosynthesis C-methylase UbiE
MEKNLDTCSIRDLWSPYFKAAEPDMDKQWYNLIYPMIKDENFSTTLDLACGAGRNSKKLIVLSKELYMVDLNEYSMNQCKENLKGYNMCEKHFIINDGISLKQIPDNSITFIYSFDSAVHFHKDVIRNYVKEFSRILKTGGTGFFHHSNYGNTIDGRDKESNFLGNPHARTNMTKELFADFCKESNLKCYNQKVIDWDGSKDLDCISQFKKV